MGKEKNNINKTGSQMPYRAGNAQNRNCPAHHLHAAILQETTWACLHFALNTHIAAKNKTKIKELDNLLKERNLK